jgi:uncharacterized protein YdeI (YjbR/CyaY-like superfamily)
MQLHFDDREDWRAWLHENHDACGVVWLVFFKKHTGRKSVEYGAAVEEALCYGWIDSLVKRLDDDRYMRKFTPRNPKSNWSESNVKRVAKMIEAGRMTEVGLAKIPADLDPLTPPSKRPLELPAFFAEALAERPAAREFFDGLAPSYRRDFVHWVSSAKRESTRKRRLAEAMMLLSEGKKLGMK